jgi:NTE family protein
MPARQILRAFVVASLLILPATVAKAECLGPPGRRVGLALSGGGARSLAQVGVLASLEAQGVHVGCVAGTSMGAVIGSLYASGYSVARLEELVRTIDWPVLFSARPERELVPLAQRLDLAPATLRVGVEGWKLQLPAAFQSDYRVNRMLTELLAGPNLAAGGDFDKLPIPFRAVATDLATGERVVLGSGSLERAVRASAAYPPRLPPVPYSDGELVDGGIVNNLPVDVVRAMGADVVIALDTSMPPLPPDDYRSATGVVSKMVEVMSRDRNRDFQSGADLTVTPTLTGFNDQSYERHQELLARGREASLDDLARLAGGAGANDGNGNGNGGSQAAPPRAAPLEGRTVGRVSVERNRFADDRLVSDVFAARTGEPLELEEVLDGIDALHATRLFDSVWVELQSGGAGATDVAVHVREGPRRVIETGTASNEADIIAGFVRFRDRNLFGGGENLALSTYGSASEAGVRATLFGDRFATNLVGYYSRAEWYSEMPRVFRDHEKTGRAEFQRLRAAFGLQRHVTPAALFRVGLLAGYVDSEDRAAFPLPASRDSLWALEASGAWDTLDDPWRPRQGLRLLVSGDKSLSGADRQYWRLSGQGRAAVRIPIGVLQAEFFAGISGDDVPAYDLYRIGGPSLMPGFHRQELWGRQALAGSLAYSVDVRALRLTARAGAGAPFAERSQIETSALLGGFGLEAEYATPLGPLMLGWGTSSHGGSRVYFSAGRSLRF